MSFPDVDPKPKVDPPDWWTNEDEENDDD